MTIPRGCDSPGDEVDTALLQTGPGRLLDLGSNLGQLISRQLARPVGLYGLFDLTVCTWIYAREYDEDPEGREGEDSVCDTDRYEGNQGRWRRPF